MSVTTLPVRPTRVTLEIPPELTVQDLLCSIAERGFVTRCNRGVLRVTRYQRTTNPNNEPPKAA